MPIFTNPLAIWCSLIFIGLIAIYLYRRRSRNFAVSSLMFFAKSRSTAEGGQKVHKLQTPLVFLIEALILLFFILAIANPMVLHEGKLIPLTIIIDDSISMSVGGDSSPKNKALRFLEEKVFAQKLYRITLIKAGVVPQTLGRRDMIGAEAENQLNLWKCDSSASNLSSAVSMGLDMSTGEALTLVITDHLPDANSKDKALKWFAFGSPLDNLAITAANRTASGRVDRCFFEFTNFSKVEREINVDIVELSEGRVLESFNAKMAPNSSRRLIIKLREYNAAVKAVINNDPLDFDNQVVLLPVRREKLKVMLDLADEGLKNSVCKAIYATELAEIADDRPNVLISDKKSSFYPDLLSQLVIHNASQPVYVNWSVAADSQHIITSDLPTEGLLWAVDENCKAKGETLLVAGNLPLLWVDNNLDSYPTLFLNLAFKNSNLHLTSFWPVFFYNFMEWSAQGLSGPTASNYRSGSKIEFFADKNEASVFVYKKEGKPNFEKEYLPFMGKVSFIASSPGLYEIRSGKSRYDVSVNLCSYQESDLTKAGSNKENMPDILENDNMSHFESVKWWFIIAAFLLLVLHQWLLSKERTGYAF